MTEALIVLGVVLVACVVAYFKCPRFKKVVAGIGVAAVAGIALLVMTNEDRKRAREVRARTRGVKEGRQDAAEDAEDTKAALDSEVKDEAAVHKEAAEDQEALTSEERQRLKT